VPIWLRPICIRRTLPAVEPNCSCSIELSAAAARLTLLMGPFGVFVTTELVKISVSVPAPPSKVT